MVQYIITPWRTPTDLLLVRRQLYPHNHNSQTHNAKDAEKERRKAVAQVSVWMQRGNCPHLVEASAILTSAILNDVPGNSSYCVRAAYSAAFCRFVTGLLDSHQTSHKKLSMYSIAKTLSLPATYVELRHQATHEELPSLAKLRSASVKALRWIWEFYWVKLSVDVDGEGDAGGERDEDECKGIVRRYLQDDDGDGDGESMLQLWDRGRVIDAVAEILDEDANADAKLLLRASRLQQRLLDSDPPTSTPSPNPTSTPPPTPTPIITQTLQALKKEMEDMEMQMAMDLNNENENQGPDTASAAETPSAHRLRLGGKGWAEWEGPWVPKPIGVV
ncbi:Pre-rRNA-processing protein las1 [Lachnellula arida]|uniref:Pre-rRNA-processing protein las1 n=1 Tax=Lachnellula arida TaxID=1316785 RepID=A0A8T9B8L7_9HELO|nr:Pre-rRNA-processing protein las1 [Lachnellula arida]